MKYIFTPFPVLLTSSGKLLRILPLHCPCRIWPIWFLLNLESKALEGQTRLQWYPAPNWQRISDLEKIFRSLKNCWDNNPLGLEEPVLQLLIHTFCHIALWLVSQEGSIAFTLWTCVWPFDLPCSMMSVDYPGLESCVLGLMTEAENN